MRYRRASRDSPSRRLGGLERKLLYRNSAVAGGCSLSAFWFPIWRFWATAGARARATLYNLAHSYIGPILLWLVTRSISSSWAVFAVLIWIAHIGCDRAVGYGLKCSSSTV